MNYAEVIYQRSLALPEAAAREALDFIDFLAQRYAGDAVAPPGSGAPADVRRRDALAHLSQAQIAWGGKPIEDRDVLHDAARD
jgi:hypothetical protein